MSNVFCPHCRNFFVIIHVPDEAEDFEDLGNTLYGAIGREPITCKACKETLYFEPRDNEVESNIKFQCMYACCCGIEYMALQIAGTEVMVLMQREVK